MLSKLLKLILLSSGVESDKFCRPSARNRFTSRVVEELVLRRSRGVWAMIQGAGLHTIPLLFAQSSFGITAALLLTLWIQTLRSLLLTQFFADYSASLFFFPAFQICTTSSIALPRRPARYAILALWYRVQNFTTKLFPCHFQLLPRLREVVVVVRNSPHKGFSTATT